MTTLTRTLPLSRSTAYALVRLRRPAQRYAGAVRTALAILAMIAAAYFTPYRFESPRPANPAADRIEFQEAAVRLSQVRATARFAATDAGQAR